MFDFFKRRKTKSIQDWEFQILNAVVDKLPPQYSFLKNQVNEDFILDSVPNEFLRHGWKRIICNQNLYNAFKNNTINYKIDGIEILDSISKTYKKLEIDIYEGIIIGYRLEGNSGQFDFSSINLKNLHESQFPNKSKGELEKILGHVDEEALLKLDINDTFKIELPEGIFYVVKDLGDGNYLSINKSGEVFGMLHDPFEIDKIFNNKRDFFDALKKGEFVIEDYFNKKTS
jgi:hypothetical protein